MEAGIPEDIDASRKCRRNLISRLGIREAYRILKVWNQSVTDVEHCRRMLEGRPRDSVRIQVQPGQLDIVDDILTREPVHGPITCTFRLA